MVFMGKHPLFLWSFSRSQSVDKNHHQGVLPERCRHQGTEVAVELAEGNQAARQGDAADEVAQDAAGVLHGGLGEDGGNGRRRTVVGFWWLGSCSKNGGRMEDFGRLNKMRPK